MINPHTIEIISCEEHSPYLMQLERLCQSEWADFKLSDAYTKNVFLPSPLAAVIDDVVIGGLAYSRFKEPHRRGKAIWINAVFVGAEHRSKGIASQLINAGVSQMLESSQDYLYACTNVPKLYQSLGWSGVDIESEPDHKVMSISLKSRRQG